MQNGGGTGHTSLLLFGISLIAGEQGTETLVLLWFAQQSLVGWWPPRPILPNVITGLNH